MKKLLLLTAMFMATTSVFAIDVVIYKDQKFGEWKGAAAALNQAVDSMVDPDNPSVDEISDMVNAANDTYNQDNNQPPSQPTFVAEAFDADGNSIGTL